MPESRPAYANEQPTQTPGDPDAGQTNFWPADSEQNSASERAQDRSYFDN